MTKTLKLTAGVLDEKGNLQKELPINRGGAEIEAIYTSDKSTSTLYTWFADLISASVAYIGDTPIAEPFLKEFKKKRIHNELLLNIPLSEVGNLILQIQRECWNDKVKNQQTLCKWCGDAITIPEIDLGRIEVPTVEAIPETIDVRISEILLDVMGLETLKPLEGKKFNVLRFRVPTLGDAIRHEKISGDEILFWRNLAFDCLIGLEYWPEVEHDIADREVISKQYISVRGKRLLTQDLTTRDLREVRNRLQNALPGANMFYEEECPCSKKRMIPYFVVPGDFFS